jgi:hypothetical protein
MIGRATDWVRLLKEKQFRGLALCATLFMMTLSKVAARVNRPTNGLLRKANAPWRPGFERR